MLGLGWHLAAELSLSVAYNRPIKCTPSPLGVGPDADGGKQKTAGK